MISMSQLGDENITVIVLYSHKISIDFNLFKAGLYSHPIAGHNTLIIPRKGIRDIYSDGSVGLGARD